MTKMESMVAALIASGMDEAQAKALAPTLCAVKGNAPKTDEEKARAKEERELLKAKMEEENGIAIVEVCKLLHQQAVLTLNDVKDKEGNPVPQAWEDNGTIRAHIVSIFNYLGRDVDVLVDNVKVALDLAEAGDSAYHILTKEFVRIANK